MKIFVKKYFRNGLSKISCNTFVFDYTISQN